MEPTSFQSGSMQPRSRQKRKRPALSCRHCRIRKLKCDRATPCAACIKSGDASTCSYGPLERREEVSQVSTQLMDIKEPLASRVDRLETLLSSVMGNTNFPSRVVPQFPGKEIDSSRNHTAQAKQENDDMEQLGKELGLLHVEPNRTSYHVKQHWVSTIFQIPEFRDYLIANSDDLGRIANENMKTCGDRENVVSLLRGTSSVLTKMELFTCLPSRAVTDMLITQFFNHVYLSIPVLHEATFREEYDEHWRNPSETEVTWLGLLFSILLHAQLSFESPAQNCVAEYKRRTIQCLVTANYTEPQDYTVECLVLYIYMEWMTSQDSNVEVSLLLGIVIRLAMRMGHHRDRVSRAFDRVIPFQGEMRRRVWAILRSMDIICSFQLSLPATIRSGDSRCAIPRNVFNHEIHKDMTGLPPSRAITEETEISCTILKTLLTRELGKILAFVEYEDDPTADDISKYERSLEDVKEMIPQHFNFSSNQGLTATSARFRRECIDLDRLYQTSQCVLHQSSLSQARQDPSKLQHRRLCIDAAMNLLAHQSSLECSFSYPQNLRKRHLYTLTPHDFYTASMAIALDIHHGFESEPFTPSPSDITLWGYDRRDEMIAALETSTEVCRLRKEQSVEAANAYGILSFVVSKARKAQGTIAEQQARGNSSTAGQTSNIFEFGAEIFNDPLPNFDWNFWTQFNEDLQPSTQWEDMAFNLMPDNGGPV